MTNKDVVKLLDDISEELEYKRDLLMEMGGVFEHSAYGLDDAMVIVNRYKDEFVEGVKE